MLAIVHNVTSLTRLLDVVSLLHGDLRLQVLFTWTRSSPFVHDVEQFLADIGAIVVPWEQACTIDADLAIAASYGGELGELKAPLVVVSHGMGYNKYLESRNRGIEESRNRGIEESRNRGIEESRNRGIEESTSPGPVFGLSAGWLLHDGQPVAERIVLSHPEQLERLRHGCPEAVPAAFVAGDPCYDRLLASLSHRRRYRRAFSVDDRRKLVVVTSTWGRESLMGRLGELLRDLLAELPLDEYRVAAILHPNIWHGHGPWQVRSWLDACLRSGLILLPPRDGWRAALVASDLVIGDHGSVTFYGAALGRPTLLGTFPHDAVDPASPVARLGRTAPRLRTDRPLRPQIDQAIAEHEPGLHQAVTAHTTSVPGRSAELLRAEFYRIMGLSEPATPPVVNRVPEPEDCVIREITATLASASWDGDTVSVVRFPAGAALNGESMPGGAHLAVDEREPEERVIELADAVSCRADRLDRPADDWLTETLEQYPGCHLAAAEHLPGESLVRLRDGTTFHVTGGPVEVHASVVYTWTGRNRTPPPAESTVLLGPDAHRVSIKPAR
ncbi:hypothetical protein [Actinomadura opuntiae]|uniref:hypothetical protein n=1 Tax=Actinomadura sp. OS1-43 TaxID=604315 RepID=UPI00255B341C|nr:hypothetical protein [Actinomadura sp. OS1-43]MDL4818627.1 hypothetical protein [Actinomadura sp. OS1-43]